MPFLKLLCTLIRKKKPCRWEDRLYISTRIFCLLSFVQVKEMIFINPFSNLDYIRSVCSGALPRSPIAQSSRVCLGKCYKLGSIWTATIISYNAHCVSIVSRLITNNLSRHILQMFIYNTVRYCRITQTRTTLPVLMYDKVFFLYSVSFRYNMLQV